VSHRIRRIASATVIATVAAVAPIAIAAPAQADEEACLALLEEAGFEGEEFAELCAVGAEGDWEKCVIALFDEDVSLITAIRACWAAIAEGDGGQDR
jgi:hypothetical protein